MIDKILELDQKQLILLMALIVLVIAVSFFFLLYRPKMQQLSAIIDTQVKEEQQIKSARLTLVRLRSAKKQADETNQRLDRIKQVLPAESDIPSIILEIQDIANQAGIEFVSIKPGTIIPNDGYAEVPLEIVIDGYFYDLVDFLYRLEKMNRAVKVTKVSITEGKKKLPNIQTTIKGSAFVIAPAAPSSKDKPSKTTPQQPGGK